MRDYWNLPRIGSPWCLVLLALAACSSEDPAAPGADGPNGSGASGGTGGPGAVAPGIDPGRVGIHRLNNAEYNNTVRDLLGVTSQPAAAFLAEEGLSFDNIASALGMTAPQYEAFFNAARDLGAEMLANPPLLARIMTCTPTAPSDACATQIIQNFGLRAYRRPLDATELARTLKVFDAEFARSANASEAVVQAVRALLASPGFLYRVELDATPSSLVPHALGAYELASRLSYLQWSSMPDDTLFQLSASGELLQTAVLEAQVDRLLADGKAAAFIESFAGQWLDIRKLVAHSVTPEVFTTYTTSLSDAMAAESYLWFGEFLSNDRPLSDWFTADFNYVNDELAQHYGFPAPGSAQAVRVEVPTDQRRGFLGLASFLTHTSFPSRTSPTLRGVWVMSELLCSPPAPPPPMIPDLEASADPADVGQASGTENVRERLERHRSDPACAGCHAMLDPVGLGLENFDGIGRYRTTYGNGDVIDSSGMLPDGTQFNGANELATIVAADPRFSACVASKLFTYALGREIDTFDAASLTKIAEGWSARGMTLRNVMKEVVVSDAFRFRRGETP